MPSPEVVQLDITKPFLCIGRLGGNYLLVQPTHRAYRVRTAPSNGKPAAEDNSGNWLHTKIDLTAGSFRGDYATHIPINDFTRFRDELLALSVAVSRRERTNRTASFRSPRGDLRLTVGADLAEIYTVTCEASDDVRGGTLLLFTLKFDRDELPSIIHSLNLMLAEFPLKTEVSA